jgi:hypothetical protein
MSETTPATATETVTEPAIATEPATETEAATEAATETETATDALPVVRISPLLVFGLPPFWCLELYLQNATRSAMTPSAKHESRPSLTDMTRVLQMGPSR